MAGRCPGGGGSTKDYSNDYPFNWTIISRPRFPSFCPLRGVSRLEARWGGGGKINFEEMERPSKSEITVYGYEARYPLGSRNSDLDEGVEAALSAFLPSPAFLFLPIFHAS